MKRKNILYGIFILLFFIYAVQIVFSNDNKPLEKHIIIENNYDIRLINSIVKDYCIRWGMLDNSQTEMYQNQTLLYIYKFDNINLLKYVAVYISNNMINIIIHYYLTQKSKWFDNFPPHLLDGFDKNNISYYEINE
ncbi:MAG: hypothetical protein LBB89_08605 [Treponema sp.]|jgi:hypothetical protein|nr:hypothetical protein [Treponema sp.]